MAPVNSIVASRGGFIVPIFFSLICFYVWFVFLLFVNIPPLLFVRSFRPFIFLCVCVCVIYVCLRLHFEFVDLFINSFYFCLLILFISLFSFFPLCFFPLSFSVPFSLCVRLFPDTIAGMSSPCNHRATNYSHTPGCPPTARMNCYARLRSHVRVIITFFFLEMALACFFFFCQRNWLNNTPTHNTAEHT